MDTRSSDSTPSETLSNTFVNPLNDESVPSSLETMFASQSVTNSVYECQEENGRTYHGYRAGTYFFPNDAKEQDRLDFEYEILKRVFSGRNYFVPLSSPRRILDIGTGTGRWAIEMGDEFPNAEVQATDLSPIQPKSVPENVHFFIDDASEDDWALPPAYFDYIHTRMMLGSFTDFGDIIKKAFYYLQPGGYMESQELLPIPFCDDGTMDAEWPVLEWADCEERAAASAGRPLRIAHKLKDWYVQAGFTDVEEQVFRIPINRWPKDKHQKILGASWEENMLSGLSGFSMAYYSRIMSWSKDQIEVYLVNVRKAISDRTVHAYHKVYVVWGKKPQ